MTMLDGTGFQTSPSSNADKKYCSITTDFLLKTGDKDTVIVFEHILYEFKALKPNFYTNVCIGKPNIKKDSDPTL